MLFITSSAFAQDLLLDRSTPVRDDREIVVETYYSKTIPNYFYTIVYKNIKGQIKCFKMKPASSTTYAALAHNDLTEWVQLAHRQYKLYGDGDIPEECAYLLIKSELRS